MEQLELEAQAIAEESMQEAASETAQTQAADAPDDMPVELQTLKDALAQKEEELTALRQDLEETRQRLSTSVAHYKTLLTNASPGLPQELVQGETIEEIEASAGAARAMVQRIRQELQAALSQEQVPAGAPGRVSPDLSSLPSHEKIALGLRRRE